MGIDPVFRAIGPRSLVAIHVIARDASEHLSGPHAVYQLRMGHYSPRLHRRAVTWVLRVEQAHKTAKQSPVPSASTSHLRRNQLLY